MEVDGGEVTSNTVDIVESEQVTEKNVEENTEKESIANGNNGLVDEEQSLNNIIIDEQTVSSHLNEEPLESDKTDKNEEQKTNGDVQSEKEEVVETDKVQADKVEKPLIYKFESPTLLSSAHKEFEPNEKSENFTKGCQWSPDGTCVLVPSEDFRLRVYELPKELYNTDRLDFKNIPSQLDAALCVKDGGLIYDTCWYPYMNSWNPSTCCFLSTSQESPVHMWDAYSGKLRATYSAYNQVDEVEAAISVQFVHAAQEIWCGFKNIVRIFNIEKPGRQVDEIAFKTNFTSISGLVSCIKENPAMLGLVAIGTYSKYVGLYKDGPICAFKVGNGVTQVEFSACGTKLFTAVRRSGELLCWDLRNPGEVLCSLQGRQSDTNQRIQFHLSPDGNHVASGGTDGVVSVWDLSESTGDGKLLPKRQINVSKDCANGVNFHRTLPLLVTTSGQRLCEDEEESAARENGVKMWWLSDV